MAKQETIQAQLEKLEKIVQWFQSRQDVDVEEGLKRVKEGAELVKTLNARLKKVENEFKEVKKDLDADSKE